MYRWDTYGKNKHLVGFFLHFYYIIVLTIYTDFMYVLDKSDPHTKHNLEVALISGVVYPAFYDWI